MVITELPPCAEIPIPEVRSRYELEGDSSRDLLTQYGIAVKHSRDRPSFSGEFEDDLDAIHHVPFKKVGTIRVRFMKAKPMKPRMIDTDEFDLE